MSEDHWFILLYIQLLYVICFETKPQIATLSGKFTDFLNYIW